MIDHERDRERLGPAALLLIAVGALGLVGIVCQGCRTPPPGTPGTGQRIVNCATQAVADTWPEFLPQVNGCLAHDTGAMGCLLSLIQPAVGATEDLIACLVRNQGAAYAHAAQANPGDAVSVRAAAAARQWLIERNVVFVDGAR
jgi:hypothetical protein